SFDISFCTDTVIPRRSTPSSSALIPMVVLMHVASAVATRSVGENASPFPLLSVGASVAILDCEGPCVASQCKSPVYSIETLTINDYAAPFSSCHVEGLQDISNVKIRMSNVETNPNAKMLNGDEAACRILSSLV